MDKMWTTAVTRCRKYKYVTENEINTKLRAIKREYIVDLISLINKAYKQNYL